MLAFEFSVQHHAAKSYKRINNEQTKDVLKTTK